MMIQAARLPLKQHRFELAAAALAATAVGAAALWVNARLVALNVPPGCFDAWLSPDGLVGPACDGAATRFSQINGEEAGIVFAAMAVIPLAAGLLAGVPLVGRELEARTAQTAWALAPSRRRWFVHQLWPVVVAVGATVVFAALSASVLEATRAMLNTRPLSDLGLYGASAVSRAVAALGIGLAAGAVLGRTLPAFIVGAVISIGLVSAAGVARDVWLRTLPPVAFDQAAVGDQRFDGILLEQAWLTPDKAILSEPEAMFLAASANAADPYQWLIDNGYHIVQLGITAHTARGWEPLETAGFALIGLALVGGTVQIVERRRPT